MKPLKTLYAAAAFALAALAPAASQAAGVEVLNEGFGTVPGFPGWVQVNNSAPPGTGWFQGNPGIFAAHTGAPDSYAAANYLGAAGGMGTVDNWLFSPILNLTGQTVLTFFARSELPLFSDQLEVRYAPGGGTNIETFDTVLFSLAGDDLDDSWQRFTGAIAVEGPGRFAFRYFGPAENLSYVGLDSVRVVTAVPEPSLYLMLLAGLGAVAFLRRVR